MRAILWGGTGQAKEVRPILEAHGAHVCALFDNGKIVPPFPDVPLLGGEDVFDASASATMASSLQLEAVTAKRG